MRIISKSIVALMAAMLMTYTASCSGDGSEAGDGVFPDTATYTLRSDTVSDLYGRLVGYRLAQELRYYVKATNDSTYNFDDFVAGVEAVVGQRRPMENISGISLGLRIEAGDMRQLDNSVVKIDRLKILASLRRAMSVDSVSPFEQTRRSTAFEQIMNRFATDSTSVPLADSLAVAYGSMIGTSIAAELTARDDLSATEKEYFIKGIETIVGKKCSDEFLAGVSSGINMAQDMAATELRGVNVRRNVVMDRVKESFKKDSIPATELEKVGQQYGELMTVIDEEYKAREDKRLAATDEAIKNIKTGEALVSKMKKATPEARTTSSGLTYLIANTGAGDRIKDDDKVIVKYTGSHLDGKVFDSNEKATVVPKLMIKGFAEGLRMLGKGGKATFWIPGSLGYGGRGVPQAGIGPMETLVFDVEIIDIEKPDTDTK